MINREFDPQKPLSVVIYRRMSSELQNKRSPDQQEKEIQLRLKSLRRPWKVIKVYTDEAKSGRMTSNRPLYQKMLQEVKARIVRAEAILVDTMERFGRVDELSDIRKDLLDHFGVVVLSADNNFTDPNSTQGRALMMAETFRATEEGHVKAHNVFRGKRDAVELGHWPGGVAPFGYRRESVVVTIKGLEKVDHTVLVPDPETGWIIFLLFSKALESGWGTTRLANWLNDNPDIPAKFKPFCASTIGRWLDDTIYFGELHWPKHSTGVIDNARVVVANEADDVKCYPGFCEPLVARADWDGVQALREARRKRNAGGRKKADSEEARLIVPRAPGLVLRYLFTGLVCCGECKRAMTPSSSKYDCRDGSTTRYVAYVCPGYLAGLCSNAKRVPEEWLRTTVLDCLRSRLCLTK